MRRRTRVDLGQQVSSSKEETILNRKRKRWAERNQDKDPEENPFLTAIKPDQKNFGDEDEQGEELRKRLSNLEFGNFPGYFNYRNKASIVDKITESTAHNDIKNDNEKPSSGHHKVDSVNKQEDGQQSSTSQHHQIDSGLSDERLKFLKQEWFEGKEVLDIGCNRGHITYAIARSFKPKSIVGIDIDIRMINMANKDLHLHLEDGIISRSKEDLRERAAKQRLVGGGGDSNTIVENSIIPKFPLSVYITDGPLSQQADSKLCKPPTDEKLANNQLEDDVSKFPDNIIFVEHNYVLSQDDLIEKQKPHFDTIVCLSVTKWIHLNYCDAGLKRFFKRIYRHLRQDGLLILESQPFDNYGRRKKLSDRLRANFYSIQFKPDQFDDYLLSKEVGFRSIVYQSVTDHRCVGFKRPLKVFLK